MVGLWASKRVGYWDGSMAAQMAVRWVASTAVAMVPRKAVLLGLTKAGCLVEPTAA